MTVETLIKLAWDEHSEQPEGVANRLADSLGLLREPQHIAPFARLVTHVFGEHLGQWHRGVALLESLRGLPAFDGSATIAGPLNRNIATLRYASGESRVLESLSLEDRVATLAGAAAAFAGRKEFKRALEAYREALHLARAGLPSDSPAIRSVAVAGNNLAAALEEKKARSADETAGMIAAALGGVHYWKLAGTWLEEERAEYRLARSLLTQGVRFDVPSGASRFANGTMHRHSRNF